MDDHVTRDLPLTRTAEPRPQPPRSDTRRRSRWPGLIGLLLLAAFLSSVAWIVLRPHAPPQTGGGRFSGGGPMPVVTATAAKGDIPVTLNALGTVTPLATVTVRTQINGQLLQVGF